VAMLSLASESGTIFPSKNACFERSTGCLQAMRGTSSYSKIITEGV